MQTYQKANDIKFCKRNLQKNLGDCDDYSISSIECHSILYKTELYDVTFIRGQCSLQNEN